MLTKRGNVEVTVDGNTFGFRIGTWTFRQSQIALGVDSIDGVLEKIGLLDNKINIDAYLKFLYEAALDYRYEMKIDGEISIRDVSSWLDAMGGVTGSLNYIIEGLKQYVSKNEEAPKTEQAKNG